MKKIKLDAHKLQLKKEKIASLTNEQMGRVIGGQPVTTATFQTCCLPTQELCDPSEVKCPPTWGCYTEDGETTCLC